MPKIREFTLVIEGDANGYSAHVPELPTIVVTGESVEELLATAEEAVRIYLGVVSGETEVL